jgi:putative ABC transport system permease protein
MNALNRKLLRDLWRLRGQVLAIAMVVASGVAVLVMSLTTLSSLQETAATYYERYRFADVFASVTRAPEHLAARIADIPGVQHVETRISKLATLDITGFGEPVIGQLVSIPERGESVLNRLALLAGRRVQPDHPDEVVLSEPFADAHRLDTGSRLHAIINGKRRQLTVVGIALSPEHVYAIGPGALMPDNRRFGVLWMGREALEAAYDLDGAFNDVTLSLLHGTQPEAVIQPMDQLLARYGGIGAIARADQLSNWFLINEIDQLETLARILPTVFLVVAAFLTNMVLARIIATERSEIGLMKAFGYRNTEIAWHYARLVMAITAVGIVLGWLVGAWFGKVSTGLYAEFYRFPLLIYAPQPSTFAIGALVSLGAALAGTFGSLRRAAMLPPAEAMRPPAPTLYRRTRLSTSRIAAWLDQPTRIILRQIVRWPGRSLLTSAGIALSVGVLVMALQWIDSINHIVQVYFFDTQRQDMMVGLVEAQSDTAAHELAHLPGVLSVEPMRIVSAYLRHGNRSHRGALTGVPPDAQLQRVYDAGGYVVPLPPGGVVLGTKLAEKLGVTTGDTLQVDVLEGRRPQLQIPVVGLFETYIGIPAFIDLATLNRLLKERPSLEYANLLVDDADRAALYAGLKAMPEISAVMLREAAISTFHDTLAETLLIYISFFAMFACTLGFGVVYNSTRIALSERGRELATLRVIGFSRAEISYILLGEVALLIFIGLPLGCLAGQGLAWLMTTAFETELYRVPLVIELSTYGTAVLVALLATAASAALVRRRLDRLDLVSVLKTRE